MQEHRITISYDDGMTAINLVEDLDKILKDHGIRLEIEDELHDGFDVCIVTINDKENDKD